MSDDANKQPLIQYFRFEMSALRLSDGSYFQPLRDAVVRWVFYEQLSPRIGGGFGYKSLYRLKTGTFVKVISTSQTELELKDSLPLRIIESDAPVSGARIDVRVALDFLVEAEFEIPDDLQQVLNSGLNESDSPPPRPLDFWASQKGLSSVELSAHDVRVIDRLTLIRDAAIAAVQEIREWPETDSYDQKRHLTIRLAALLFDRYRVDPNHWWGSKNSVPPSDVDLLELPWPEGVDKIKTEVIPQLRKLIRGPAIVFYGAEPNDQSSPPTNQEIALATEHLVKNLPAIEDCTVRIGKCIADLLSGQIYRDLRDTAPAALKPPSSDDIAAYLQSILYGLTHAEINERLKLGKAEGTISRMIKRAKLWSEQGNPLPGSTSELPSFSGKTISMDPTKIDLGANREGRSPRQRNRKTD